MKKVFFVLAAVIGISTFTSCNPKKQATVEEITVATVTDQIVKDSIVGKDGSVMYLTFNNAKGLVNLVHQGDTITLIQDTTASGIRFNNAQYIYEEWQGKVTLKKDGSVVFENNR